MFAFRDKTIGQALKVHSPVSQPTELRERSRDISTGLKVLKSTLVILKRKIYGATRICPGAGCWDKPKNLEQRVLVRHTKNDGVSLAELQRACASSRG